MILLRLRVYPKPFYVFKYGKCNETGKIMITTIAKMFLYNKKDTATTVS